MSKINNAFRFIFQNRKIHGLPKTAVSVAYKFLQRTIGLTNLNIILLDKVRLRKKDVDDFSGHSFRYATERDLQKMKEINEFEIDNQDIAALKSGELCLLHFVKKELTGYTWAHPRQSPTLLDGIRLRIPESMIYNYKGFTHPNFRGKGYQALRYHRIFDDYADKAKTSLVGYVEITNWASQRGQRKGGYEVIGRLCYLAIGKKVLLRLSGKLRAKGIGLEAYTQRFGNLYILRKGNATT